MLFSINRMAQIFDVDRTTVSNWVRRGLPHVPQTGLGRPSQLDFETVLTWRKADLLSHRWANEERIADMEKQARARLNALKPAKRSDHGTRQ